MRSSFVLLVGLAAGCGLPDDTIDLLPGGAGGGGTAGAGGQGHGGGGTGGGCLLNTDCGAPTPQCDTASGTCVTCPAGLSQCGDACVDTAHDALHCDGCDSSCGHNQACAGGACVCLPGTELCSGGCHDITSDAEHCGSCDHPCDPGQKCEGGTCGAGACSPGLEACPVSNDRTSCVHLDLGVPFCGACGVACAPGEVCVDDQCRALVPATPCTSCPCSTYCDPAFPESSTCCDDVYGLGLTACVHHAACP